MNDYRNIIFVLACFLFSAVSSAQQLENFTYAGNKGKSQYASVKVQYVLYNGSRMHNLEVTDTIIDLNEYKGPVFFGISFSDLKFGLNNKRTKQRHPRHYKNFYLKIFNLTDNFQGFGPVPSDTMRIASKDDHLGKLVDVLHYQIDTITKRTTVKFQVGANTIGKEYNNEWNSIRLTKKIKLIPRPLEKSKKDSSISDADGSSKSSKKRSRKRKYTSNSNTSEKDDDDTLESRIWADIEKELQTAEKKKLLGLCKLYKTNCDEGFMTSCKHLEDVIFYMALQVSDAEKKTIIADYYRLFPDGKYREQLQKLIIKPEPKKIPIEEGLAKVEFDKNALVVSRVKGGKLPYYIGFFNEDKSKEFAVKGQRFSEENITLHLDSLNMPEGNYVVKVLDADNQIFAQEQNVFVAKKYSLSNSVKLTIVLILVGFIGFLYKKYIHF